MSNEHENSNFFSNDDEEISLEKLMAQDAEDNANEGAALKKDAKREKNKKIALISSGGVLAAAVVAGLLLFNPFSANSGFDPNNSGNDGIYQGQNDNGENKEEVEEDNKVEDVDKDIIKDNEDFIFEEGKLYPIQTEEWQTSSYDSQKDEGKLRELINAKVEGSTLENASSILPLEAAGFTSDESKKEVDGELNSMYSFWTAEDFSYSVAEMTERLLNPTFGSWGDYQYSYSDSKKAFNVSLIEDMFTSNFLSTNVDKDYSEYIPVYADWDKNDYGKGKELLSGGTRWIGEVTNSTADFTYNDDEENYTVKYSADVKFTAWTKDEAQLEKNGKLTLTLVANTGDNKKDSKYKVLIDNASLKVDG